MKTIKATICKKLLILPAVLILILLFIGCSTSELKVSEYDFIYNGQSYVIRSSYCPNNPRSCNQIIGGNFVAVDMNQDRIIDKITKGNKSLAEAQEIYDYCLTLLEHSGKLNEVNKVSPQFELKETDYTFSIKSFSQNNGEPFTEFKIEDKRNGLGDYKVSIFVDEGADGKLDKVLKGGLVLQDAQQMYSKVIAKGTEQARLEIVDGVLIVK